MLRVDDTGHTQPILFITITVYTPKDIESFVYDP